jgi:hypothetical protein
LGVSLCDALGGPFLVGPLGDVFDILFQVPFAPFCGVFLLDHQKVATLLQHVLMLTFSPYPLFNLFVNFCCDSKELTPMYFDEYIHKYVFKVLLEAITYFPHNHFKSN